MRKSASIYDTTRALRLMFRFSEERTAAKYRFTATELAQLLTHIDGRQFTAHRVGLSLLGIVRGSWQDFADGNRYYFANVFPHDGSPSQHTLQPYLNPAFQAEETPPKTQKNDRKDHH